MIKYEYKDIDEFLSWISPALEQYGFTWIRNNGEFYVEKDGLRVYLNKWLELNKK